MSRYAVSPFSAFLPFFSVFSSCAAYSTLWLGTGTHPNQGSWVLIFFCQIWQHFWICQNFRILFLKIRWPVIIWHFTAFRQKFFEKSVKISMNFKNIRLNIFITIVYSSKTEQTFAKFRKILFTELLQNSANSYICKFWARNGKKVRKSHHIL